MLRNLTALALVLTLSLALLAAMSALGTAGLSATWLMLVTLGLLAVYAHAAHFLLSRF